MHEKKALVFMRMVLQPRRLNRYFGALKAYCARRLRQEAQKVLMDAHYCRVARRQAIRVLRRYRQYNIAKVRGGGKGSGDIVTLTHTLWVDVADVSGVVNSVVNSVVH